MTGSDFKRDDGTPIPSVPFTELQLSLSELENTHHLSSTQYIEDAAYSLAMVVRFALGLSAQGGLICAMVRDSVPGAVAIAGLRHLVNAGSEAVLLVIDDSESKEFNHISHSIASAESYGINVEYWKSAEQTPLVEDVVKQCHNVLFGGALIEEPTRDQAKTEKLINGAVSLLNELSTPVHCVFAPHGFSLTDGRKTGELLYASSTLSLGAPLQTLRGKEDLIGRHYLADISLPLSKYKAWQDGGGSSPFTEQPVVQIFPIEIE